MTRKETAQRIARDLNDSPPHDGFAWKAGTHPRKPDDWAVLIQHPETGRTIAYMDLDDPELSTAGDEAAQVTEAADRL